MRRLGTDGSGAQCCAHRCGLQAETEVAPSTEVIAAILPPELAEESSGLLTTLAAYVQQAGPVFVWHTCLRLSSLQLSQAHMQGLYSHTHYCQITEEPQQVPESQLQQQQSPSDQQQDVSGQAGSSLAAPTDAGDIRRCCPLYACQPQHLSSGCMLAGDTELQASAQHCSLVHAASQAHTGHLLPMPFPELAGTPCSAATGTQ